MKNHFTVDPDKFDFYAMDCCRTVGEDALATLHADEVIRKSTAPDGTIRTPMRVAEAKITFAVAAARQGDLEQATTIGNDAFDIPRQSVPSLIHVGRDLATELNGRYHHDEAAAPFLNRFADLLVAKD